MPGTAASHLPVSVSRPAGLNGWWVVPGVCVFLVVITFAVFGQTLGFDFVNYDDNDYVYANPEVTRGLTFQGIGWAFTHFHASNWHPLTWISHMLDCQFYGLNPAGHHLTNVLLQATAAILLFLVLRQMTGFLWRSAFVAAVFAIHPLRVESVAWVAERKDVLSGVFFMLIIGAYVRYAQRRRPRDYVLVLVLFAMGLMCKPMLVTLPLVLLLLDYWPLNRGAARAGGPGRFLVLRRLMVEKLPLFGLAAGSCIITIFAQTAALQPLEKVSLSLRVGNALISYVVYLGQMFWPSDLVVLYPFSPREVGLTSVALSVAVLAVISTGVFILRRHRYLMTGWLWYLVMLAPVIGILQVGEQARADRYTYLPQIGLYLLLAWAVAELGAGWRYRRALLGGCSMIILVALIFCARAQAAYWRNSELLWTHTLACAPDNKIAHNNLGIALFQNGRLDGAVLHYQKALEMDPNYGEAHYNLGNALRKKGRVDEAIWHYQKVLQREPKNADVHNNFGNALIQKGDVAGAIAQYQKALATDPQSAPAHFNLGNALLQSGRTAEAIAQYQQVFHIDPDHVENLNKLAWMLATSAPAPLRDGRQAVELAQRANQLTGGTNPAVLYTLSAAYAEAGRFSEAVETAQRAGQLAEATSNFPLAEAIQSQLKLYQAGVPFHSN